ncbi:polysaccharide deacetylase family protein [Anaerolentibacter hominis]|uniref:polysaccharide deacetylase family protein n=1 Tax=Anaerolentibacter hominis TaxID=3079009 RepID=UPI0031B8A115
MPAGLHKKINWKNPILFCATLLALFLCFRMQDGAYGNLDCMTVMGADTGIWEAEESSKTQKDKVNDASLAEAPEPKIAYLTFDDGPSENTRTILEILNKYDVKATFFLIGEEITPEREELLKEMVEQGHSIGIHTYCHEKEKIYASAENYWDDFNKAYEKIMQVTGVGPEILRFPWGSVNKYMSGIGDKVIKDLNEKGFTYYDWNVSGEDAVGKPTKSSIMKNIKHDLTKYNEPVILLHDGSSNQLTAEALPDIIEYIKANGYDFDVVQHRYKPYQYRRNQ